MASWSVNLVAGWNIIVYGGQSIPVENLVITPPGALEVIWYYDNATQEWFGYDPTAPAWANNLKTMENGKSYQVSFNQAGQISEPIGESKSILLPIMGIVAGIVIGIPFLRQLLRKK